METASKMVELGFKAPDFTLVEPLSGETISLSELTSDVGTIIMFLCNHCPYVQHIGDAIVDVANAYGEEGFSFVAINSNDVEKYPADSPENMAQLAEALDFHFPYLYDESQQVAKDYDAACTPDFFLFDSDLKLVYRGQFDKARPNNDEPITGESLIQALDALLAGEAIPEIQKPSMGCNIKWK